MVTALKIEDLAEQMQVEITEHRGGEKGRWYDTRRTISLRAGLHPTHWVCTLAHELGHAAHNHSSDATGWLRDRQERQASEWAAGALISREAYELAEALVGSHPGALAKELGVTTELIRVWRGLHER